MQISSEAQLVLAMGTAIAAILSACAALVSGIISTMNGRTLARVEANTNGAAASAQEAVKLSAHMAGRVEALSEVHSTSIPIETLAKALRPQSQP